MNISKSVYYDIKVKVKQFKEKGKNFKSSQSGGKDILL